MVSLASRSRHLVAVTLLVLLLSTVTHQCGPGRGTGSRRRPRTQTPLVFKQHVPNVSENTLGASGIAEGAITRTDPKFKDLVRNDNPDIKFKDEEGTGADRIMTQRCKDKLNTLAVAVMNHWPGVKLRVTEAWDEDRLHAENSLHYEGRAVDITTSDRDKSKYGMLARLAVEAGFDWVYYESRGHIHCSVKSDSSVAIKIGGCFPGTSAVVTAEGVSKSMRELAVGERVLSVDEEGRLEFTEVIAFLDRNVQEAGHFYTLTTDYGPAITVTSRHLIYVAEGNATYGPRDEAAAGSDVRFSDVVEFSRYKTLFAEDVRVGDVVLVATDNDMVAPHSGAVAGGLHAARVLHVRTDVRRGVYAPLTSSGRIVVDGVVASCYAVVSNHALAHAAFAPMRGWHALATRLPWLTNLVSMVGGALPQQGIHPYAQLLYRVASVCLSVLHVP